MTIFVSFLVVGRHIVQSQCNTECKLWSEIFDLKSKGFEGHSRRTDPSCQAFCIVNLVSYGLFLRR